MTVVPFLIANGVRVARLVWETSGRVPEKTPGTAANQTNVAVAQLHVILEFSDHLGSTSLSIDRATSELTSRSSYQAYGASEADYRPTRWNSFREDYKFTGKEEDAEIGLTYFGKRYLNAYLGRWISADPLAIHAPGEADLNVYAYVSGSVLSAIDPIGLDDVKTLLGAEIYDSIQRALSPNSAPAPSNAPKSASAPRAEPQAPPGGAGPQSQQQTTSIDHELPSTGPGYGSKEGSVEQGRHFGTERLVKGIKSAGERWHAKHPEGPRFFVGDMSKKGGGPIEPHKSHQQGVDVDIAAMRNDGKEGYRNTEVGRKDYSRELTSELIAVFEEVFGDSLKKIWFADSNTGSEKVDSTSATGQAHSHHFHVRIDPTKPTPPPAAEAPKSGDATKSP